MHPVFPAGQSLESMLPCHDECSGNDMNQRNTMCPVHEERGQSSHQRKEDHAKKHWLLNLAMQHCLVTLQLEACDSCRIVSAKKKGEKK